MSAHGSVYKVWLIVAKTDSALLEKIIRKIKDKTTLQTNLKTADRTNPKHY